MKTGIYYLTSSTASGNEAYQYNMAYLKELEEMCDYELPLVDLDELKKCDLTIPFVGTGGTESLFKDLLSNLKQPIYILTTGEANSLAASLEILSYLRQNEIDGEVIHGSKEYCVKRLNDIIKVYQVKEKMANSRIARVGKPSDWLISSDVDAKKCKEETGIEIIDIEMDDFFKEIDKKEYETNQWTDYLLAKDWPKEEVEKALYVYGALKRFVEKYDLTGLTVRCFDILQPYRTSGCAALAILNAEGIYAGCEGDVPALISMMLLGMLSGKSVFQANPNTIISDKDEIVFAHCTLPLDMPEKLECMTHYESDQGLAFRGKLPLGPITIFKASGLLNRYFVACGEVLENLENTRFCRTQLLIKLSSEDLKYFLRYSIGNHHLLTPGDYTDLIKEYFR